MLHQNESKWVTVLIERKGLEWAQSLIERDRAADIKADVHFYLHNYDRLKEIHDAL